ncbi:hypothetical protein E2C01_064202 [Portunus trituberculatus]|uniref:Uncharacterized protein n=1 Tax=Portunus trituberculatus TaxID=210409 RepID=A0A5B7HJR6_PORTR|nr:hypothetical protein [Portunus trituberculatus]
MAGVRVPGGGWIEAFAAVNGGRGVRRGWEPSGAGRESSGEERALGWLRVAGERGRARSAPTVSPLRVPAAVPPFSVGPLRCQPAPLPQSLARQDRSKARPDTRHHSLAALSRSTWPSVATPQRHAPPPPLSRSSWIASVIQRVTQHDPLRQRSCWSRRLTA